MPFDPALPVNGSLISAVELRNQLTSLNDRCNALDLALTGKAPIPAVADLSGLTISNPPTQAQVTAIRDKINELIAALTPA